MLLAARVSFARAGATGAAAVKAARKFPRLDSKLFKEEGTECTDVLDIFFRFSFKRFHTTLCFASRLMPLRQRPVDMGKKWLAGPIQSFQFFLV